MAGFKFSAKKKFKVKSLSEKNYYFINRMMALLTLICRYMQIQDNKWAMR